MLVSKYLVNSSSIFQGRKGINNNNSKVSIFLFKKGILKWIMEDIQSLVYGNGTRMVMEEFAEDDFWRTMSQILLVDPIICGQNDFGDKIYYYYDNKIVASYH